MVGTVIKEAFVEGRETDHAWQDSEARRNALRLEVFASNVENFGKTYREPILIEQVDPNTGEVKNYFSSRLEAARWVVQNVQKFKGSEEELKRKAISITGNMHMCMRCGFKSYGYFWRVGTRNVKAKVHSNTPVFAFDHSKIGMGGQMMIYPSIREAARRTGISETTIRRNLAEGSDKVKNFSFREANPVVRVRKFKTFDLAAETLGVSETFARRMVRKSMTVNNVILDVKEPVDRVIVVYESQFKKGTYKNENSVASVYKVPVAEVRASLELGTKLKNVYRLEYQCG